MRAFNVVLISLNQGSQALVMGGMALFLPMIRADIGMSYAQAGMLAATATVTYAVMQVPAGFVADRIRPKTQFLIGLLGICAFTYTFSVLHSFELLLVSQALLGIFRSLIFAPGLLLMTHQFPPNRRATAMGIYVAGGMSSNVLMSLLGPVLEHAYGWRGMFMVLVGIALILVGVQAVLGDRGPDSQPSTHSAHDALAILLTSRVMWLCCWVQFVRFAVASSVTLWLPSVLVEDKGFALSTVGYFVAVGAVVTGVSNALGGLVSDLLQRPASVITVSVAVLACVLATVPFVHRYVAVLSVVVLQAAFVQVYFGPLFEIPVIFLGQRVAGLASGVGNGFANAGALVSSLLLGWLRDATDTFTMGMFVLAALSATSVVAGVFLIRADRQRLLRLEAVPHPQVDLSCPALETA